MENLAHLKIQEETLDENGMSLLDTSDICSDSWVDLASVQSNSPERVTPLPPPLADEYVRLLREAQRESNSSSAKVSLASSRRDSPRGSPKSPPNSPNQEKTATGEEHWNSYYMNSEKDTLEPRTEQNLDWIWDWSSRPDQLPPKAWHFNHPYKTSKHLSIRYARVGETSLFSKKGLCALFITNMLSLLLGTGVGLWLSKRGGLYLPTIQVQ
ncbi:BCL2/adenovirus E1B 19 kDa protein-interacting protein 3 [Chrysoperla carnea]|uniref:BCL2/adenovirus E1B 19 kDa protein-interacting protein 3 n=1 Tax=Chrysoperla carnea TaxID=189513 RepID=UPI001D0986EB|nr:BCL2/adenovirus E1B 19 kDa protein-interacting protein 3 [Chrysoperla carnea]